MDNDEMADFGANEGEINVDDPDGILTRDHLNI